MAEWGRHYGGRLRQARGFTRTSPCAATRHTVLRHVDREVLEAKLRAWTEGLLCGCPAPDGAPEAITMEGKTLRGSRQQRAPGAHLAFSGSKDQ